MSPTTTQDGQARSFLGLQSYTEAQSNSFFGRDAEIDTLTSLIGLNMLTIVFGRSGTGKTSLLNAGVFPGLRKSFCLPFRIRLDFSDKSPDLISQIKKVLKEEIDKYGFKVESYPGSETLWEYFHKEPLWKTVTPVLVFDQFEEIFTLSKSNPRFAATELPAFWEELSDLIENNIPEKLKEKFLEEKEKVGYNYKSQKAKVVFSFREEYLPEFETITAKIPSIKFSRFRLLPMNGNQAYEVITKTWKENISTKEAKYLVSYFTNVTGSEDYSLLTVEPSLLSQVCAYIDKGRMESGGGKVSAELLNRYPKDTILRSIYNETVQAADSSLNIPVKKGEAKKQFIKEFIEEKLITTQGYRTKYQLTVHEDLLKPGIYVLTARYLVREDDGVVELTHDVLAPIIKTDREKRRKEAAMVAVRKKARKRALVLLLAAFLIGAASYAYIVWQAKKDENALIQRTIALQKMITSDSARLKEITDSLDLLINSLTKVKSPRHSNLDTAEIVPGAEADSNYHNLMGQIQILKQQYGALKIEYDKKTDTLRQPRLMKLPKLVFPERDSLYDLLEIRQKKYDSLLAEYDKLKKLFDSYTNRFPDPVPIQQKKVISLDTTNSLRVKLYYGSKYNKKINPPDNLTIYLIPYTQNNTRIIKNAKVYEINCDESDIKKAIAYKTAVFMNGFYYFPDVNSGKYLIKICTYYGGFYNYTKRSSGMETLNWDASPPIR